MKRLMALVVILAASVGFLSCGDDGDNYLNGSVKKNFHISYDGVRARLYTSELSIEYHTKSTEGEVALRVAVDVDTGLKAGESYDLMADGDINRDEGFGELPEMVLGKFKLNQYGSKAGSTVAGSFSATFITSSGAKMSLSGGFSAGLEIIPL